MFDKLRRRRKASVVPSASVKPSCMPQAPPTTSNAHANSSTTSKTTFFDLPSELRISIYELVARDTRLSLFHASPKHVKTPALLLTSRQIRNEYRPVLLSLAPVRAHVGNYNFKPIMRVVGSLYSTELKALRKNNNLTIVLHLKNFDVTSEHCMTSLRRWAVKRAEHLDRLPWSYELVQSTASSLPMAAAVAQMCRLEKSIAAVHALQKSVHESLAAEIEPITELLLTRCAYWRDAITYAWRTGTWEFVHFD
ncbi:hypothetical protein Q7P35_000358 [Cladosporium inversicolor]